MNLIRFLIRLKNKDWTAIYYVSVQFIIKKMRKELKGKEEFEEIGDYSVILTGRFAFYRTALVLVDSRIAKPIGYRYKKDEVPEWITDKLGIE
jgi:hypothetical protein